MFLRGCVVLVIYELTLKIQVGVDDFALPHSRYVKKSRIGSIVSAVMTSTANMTILAEMAGISIDNLKLCSFLKCSYLKMGSLT